MRRETTPDEIFARRSTTAFASSAFNGFLFVYPTLILGFGRSVATDAITILLLTILGILGVVSFVGWLSTKSLKRPEAKVHEQESEQVDAVVGEPSNDDGEVRLSAA